MAEMVTVEGTINPCVYLAHKERKTVELDAWRGKIRKGFAVIVAYHGDPEAELAAPAPAAPTPKPAPAPAAPKPAPAK